VFTREIALGASYHYLGADVGYEVHKGFETTAGAAIFKHLRDQIQYVAISNALKQYLIDEFDIGPNRILVAHDGVDIARYEKFRQASQETLRRNLDLPETRHIAVYTGNHRRERPLDQFLPLIKTYPETQYVFVGGSNEEIQYWEENFDHAENVRFVPHCSQETVARYQMAADILLLPMSKRNPLWWCTSPLKLFEYWASGTPALVAAIGSLTEVVSNETAFCFDPSEPSSLERAFNNCRENPEDAKDRSNHALELVKHEYTWKRRAEKIRYFIGIS
jgi:glycosyltransferase involved in cell wall biosynthesis